MCRGLCSVGLFIWTHWTIITWPARKVMIFIVVIVFRLSQFIVTTIQYVASKAGSLGWISNTKRFKRCIWINGLKINEVFIRC